MRHAFIFLSILQYILVWNVESIINSNVCGIRFKNRIVGGSETSPNEWPWMVSIQLNYKHICGATLIDRQWVITAAHCFNFNSASAYKVIIGGHNITNSGLGTNAIRRSVIKILKHESFVKYQAFDFDIALLKLDKPVGFNNEILPACVAFSSDNFEGSDCYFAGWGFRYSNGITQSTLRDVNLKVLSMQECSQYVYDRIEQKYCTGAFGALKDTCQGDSGGGMMCLKTDLKWYLAGIVSYGLGECGNVGVNARADYFRKWIDFTIDKNR